MSQEDVYEILRGLGGEATQKEIKEKTKEKYPNTTLYLYISHQFRKLERGGCAKKIRNKEGNDN